MISDDLTGRRFERLLVLEKDVDCGKKYMWKCICDCGKELSVRADHLIKGESKSCGCWIADKTRKRNKLSANNIRYEFKNDCVVGKFDDGTEFLIDVDDYPKISSRAWTMSRKGYLRHAYRNQNNKCRSYSMHQFILGYYGNDFQIDHVDRNKLNNKKSNLRFCGSGENNFNIGERKDNKTGFSGVQKRGINSWRVDISYHNKRMFVGSYKSFEEAVRARYEAEKKYFGEFAPHTEQDVIKAIENHLERERNTQKVGG